MNEKLASWNDIAVFVRVAQLGSFSAAARQSAMPVSTISRRVAELEAQLGVSLLKRTTRKLHLTEPGAALYERCALHLEGLEDAVASATKASTELEGTLHVTAPVALGRGELIAFVAGFLAAHPKLRIDLAITNENVDLVASRVDVAIRFGPLASSTLMARKLGTSHRVLVAAPAYLLRRRAPKHPRELAEHETITFGAPEWALLSGGQRRTRVPLSPRATANNLETVNELARLGLGIALLPASYLREEGLVRVLPRWSSVGIPVHALHAGKKFSPAKVRVFLDALAAWKNATWQ